MAYTKKTWVTGEVIKADDLNNMESGIAEALPKTELPTALKNPKALTFSGAVSATYDGSASVTVNIPAGGSSGGGTVGSVTLVDTVTGETTQMTLEDGILTFREA